MAKFHARPSLQYRYEHYDPFAGSTGVPSASFPRRRRHALAGCRSRPWRYRHDED